MVMKFDCEFRVLYEVFPMSYLMEQAGGQSFTGKQRVFSCIYVSLLSYETYAFLCFMNHIYNTMVCRHLIWFQRKYMIDHQYSLEAMMKLRKSKSSMQNLKVSLEERFYKVLEG